MTVERTAPLHFTSASQELETHTNLSAVRSDGEVLWVAGDETATVERLVAEGDGWGGQTSFALAELVDLPGAADEEADVEGLARDGGFLWAVGSHSLRRKRVKDKHDGAKALERLATVEGQANRQLLLRLPLEVVDGLPRPVRETARAGGVDGEVQRAAAFGSRVIILDEPTAALGVKESRRVLDLIQDVRSRGIPIVLISHNMPHVFEVADRVHIHRLGKRLCVIDPKQHSMSDAVAYMTGARAPEGVAA